MPFYNNVYYPFSSEPQGAHSSAGIPSLLNSPQSQLSSGSQSRLPGSAMSRVFSGGATAAPGSFKFRARHGSVDWRRISAVDVDRVACELDFQTLQDHITAVTFCSVEGERCPRCQSQVDPALLKLFRLAQFTVEYLLHSQDCLTLSLQAAEERLQAEAREREQLSAQLQKQTQDAKTLKEELRQRKKIIASQQAMITAGITNYHKCHHCDKAFMNAPFLQSHMQRRHPMEFESKQTDNQKNVQTVKLREEINRLQEQLSRASSQMEMQQKDYSAKQIKDEEFMKQLESWKEEEQARMNCKIDEVKQACQREMDSLHQRNRNLEKKVLKLQQSNKMQESTPAIQAHASSMQNTENKHLREVDQLQQKLHKQEIKWTSKMQKVNVQHESERSQLQAVLEQMRSGQEEARRQRQESELELQEQRQIIASMHKQIKQITSNTTTSAVQQEVVASPVPEPKSKAVISEQSNSVYKLDPIVELSEEDKDSSSLSESLAYSQSWQQKVDELLKKPGLKRDMRVAVQQNLHDKLLSLGIQPQVSEISKAVYSSAIGQLVSERQQRQVDNPEYTKVRKEAGKSLEQRLKENKMEASTQPRLPVQAIMVAQSRPRSHSLPTTVTRVVSGPRPRQQHTPQPAPRNKTGTLTKTSTAVLNQNGTPPFSSDEDSSEEEESEEESPQAQKASQPKVLHENTTKKSQPQRAQPCPTARAASSPLTSTPHPAALQPSVQLSEAHQAPVLSVSRTQVTALESDWSEGSEIEEIELDQLRRHTDQNGNVQKTFQSNVKALTKTLEQQLAGRDLLPPAGAINTVPGKPTGVSNINDVVRELKYTKDNHDDDDDDDDDEEWDISSLEDIPADALVRKSTDRSVDTSTSVWGTSTGRGQKPGTDNTGLNDAGTGSTLKSSIVTVSDWDDSDDI